MRILRIRFKNLNSLAGEWEIDLTHPAIASDGIFAITGPTGAGKTTILDAICLALYGQTPRLDKVTKSGNEIMSRQTGECFAEVTFETQTGRFRCHWSQHRARKKPDGELQAQKHEISHADSGEIFGSGISGVADRVEAATGMDFRRFTQSMLLAQGDFAAFLQASPDGRAPILEQITGTEIYSRISIHVHERRREEEEKLSRLQAETAGIAILDPERENEIRNEIAAKEKEEEDLAGKLAGMKEAVQWLDSIARLRKEIGGLAEEAVGLQRDIEAFKPERERLDRATRAAALDGLYATLAAIRKQQTDAQAALRAGEAAFPGLEASAREQSDALRAAEQQAGKAKEEREAAAPLIRETRSLDQRLADQKKAVTDNEADCERDAEKIDEARRARLQEEEKRATAQGDLKLVGHYLAEHVQDEWLIGGLTGVEEQLNNLLSSQKEISRKEADRKKAAAARAKASETFDRRQQERGRREQALADVSRKLQQERDGLNQLLGGRLLREYRAEKETLLRERAFLARIAELEEHRAKLEDGQPCPLCGAREHPFAAGNVPVPDAIDEKIAELARLTDEAEAKETSVRKFENEETAARERLTDGRTVEAVAANDKKAADSRLAELTEDMGKLQADFDERKQAAIARLQPLGVAEIPDSNILSLLESLGKRRDAWQDKGREKAGIEKRLDEIELELARSEMVIKTQSEALAEKQKRLEILKKEHASGCDERKLLYGDRDPDLEEHRLSEAVAAADVAERKARERELAARQKLSVAKTNIESFKNDIARRTPELGRKEGEFAAELKTRDFADERRFLEARLADGRREELSAEAKKLDERQTDLRARQRQKDLEMRSETARQVTDKSLAELEPQLEESENSLRRLRDAIAALGHTLRENAAARERMEAKQAGIDAQRRECARWNLLHELIGSSDGKKYRNFAQGLTFEILIHHANRQLRKMTDRYLLDRDDRQPLELVVIDDYQAGERRSTKNLSGGESFIVSLALALGLSRMAGKKVRVDSLFLDEGFGTLDEKAFDTAMETLASLRRDGKLIGIISHVPAIMERVSARIQVIPQIGGKSQISGPGCVRLDIANGFATTR